ncbi:MAG: hypothetical protein HFJ27_01990 [Clostridia bacterium]|nr:hypothetical protein [Clostridia bacterium]
MKKNQGITLIALVITIIVLLILAGITINLLLGENGVFTIANEGKKSYSKAEAKEKLEIVLLDLQADKVTDVNYNEEEYIDESLRENGIEVEGDIAIIDGWQFEIDRSVPKIGKELEKLTPEEMKKPIITSLRTIVAETQVQVKIKLRNEEGRSIIYTIMEIRENGEKVNIERTGAVQELEYTFKNLKKGQKYEIKIEASNEYGSDSKEKVVETQRPILVSKIIFDKEEENVFINHTKELKYRIEPENATNKEIRWETSDNKIATVKNGIVTPIKSGICIVTATALDESGISATCKINVVNGISTVEELIAVNNDLLGNYVLLNDIDLSGIDWMPIGTPNSQSFEGTFDGQGYSIKNLNKPLFKSIGKESWEEAVVKNLNLENVSIDLPNEYDVGALAFTGYFSINVSNVKVTGNIRGKDYVAGLLGKLGLTDPKGPIINNCYVRANITSTTNHATAGITLAWGNKGVINNCYFSGEMNGTAEPIVVILYGCSITTSNCYYDSTSIKGEKSNAIGIEKQEFANAANFKNWDFENTWIIKEGFPELRILFK